MENNGTPYRIDWEGLCGRLGLGCLLSEPKPLNGGFLHRMFEVNTGSGRYAVKALNPEIMGREEALSNYEFSERAANQLAEILPVSHARQYDGTYVQSVNGQYYLIYDFVEGRTLTDAEITGRHAYRIGCALAQIHGTDAAEPGAPECPRADPEPAKAEWESYARLGREGELVWAACLEESLGELNRLSERCARAFEGFCGRQALCHNDLDPKNVMWRGDEPVVIDWKAAGFSAVSRDFLETALYWSQNADGSVDRERFLAFAHGYTSRRGLEAADWNAVLYQGLASKLEWLEYSLKRSLGLTGADEAERRLGTEQVVPTVRGIQAYVKNIPELTALLREAGARQEVRSKAAARELPPARSESVGAAESLLPQRLRELVGDRPYRIDGVGMSGATILLWDDAVLKIEPQQESFPRVVSVMQWLKGKLPVPEVLAAFSEDGRDYLLMTKIEGDMACSERYMEQPELLLSLLAEVLQMLWAVDISDCPYERGLDAELAEARYNVENGLVDMENVQPDTFGENGFADASELLAWLEEHRPQPEPTLSHGDFCLPNLLLRNGQISGLIDLGKTGVADRWKDIALCYRSLKDVEIVPERLFDALGLEPDWEKIRYYILLDELF